MINIYKFKTELSIVYKVTSKQAKFFAVLLLKLKIFNFDQSLHLDWKN